MAIMYSRIATALSVLAVARAQQIGTNTAEVHPSLSWQTCTAPGVCTTNAGSVVLDSNWRWTHNVGGSTNCYTGNTWNAAYCPSDAACATNWFVTSSLKQAKAQMNLWICVSQLEAFECSLQSLTDRYVVLLRVQITLEHMVLRPPEVH